jgi:hypothetical protein
MLTMEGGRQYKLEKILVETLVKANPLLRVEADVDDTWVLASPRCLFTLTRQLIRHAPPRLRLLLLVTAALVALRLALLARARGWGRGARGEGRGC